MRGRVSIWRALAFVVLALGLTVLAAQPAAAKDFTIDSIRIDATVRPNGNVRVVETRTLTFSGSFSYVYWDLNTTGSDGIEVVGAQGPAGASLGGVGYTEEVAGVSPSTYSISESPDSVRVQLNFAVTDATAEFGIEYVARGAAKRWEDTAELYWQFVGDEAQIQSRDVRITVHLPEGVTKEEVRAWAHGPLWGDVAIADDASVVLSVDPLPAYTFVESRILFPAAALANAPLAGGAREAEVLAEEQRFADEANRARQWARIKVVLWGVLGFGAPLVALILVVWFYFRYGREPKPKFRAEYLRDVPQPDLPPALVSYIWRMGGFQRDDATATLLDLVNRKVLDIERLVVHRDRLFGRDEELTYKLTVNQQRLDELQSFERKLVKLLFDDVAGGPSLVLSELKGLAKEHRETFAKGYAVWKKAIGKAGERSGYLVSRSSRKAVIGMVASACAIGGAFLALVMTGWPVFLVGMLIGAVLIFVSRAIKQRSPEAAELHAQYTALERYLKHFGRMQEKPPDAVVVWERFLVYAVVFGIADEVVKAMRVRVPDVVVDPAFGPSYMLWFAGAGDGGGVSAFSALHESFGAAVSVATSSSSSSGGGGGFSGGGGGGGGGGGFGAG